jgi:hypothetical protein
MNRRRFLALSGAAAAAGVHGRFGGPAPHEGKPASRHGANEFAATTTRSPPARTAGSRGFSGSECGNEALTSWGRRRAAPAFSGSPARRPKDLGRGSGGGVPCAEAASVRARSRSFGRAHGPVHELGSRGRSLRKSTARLRFGEFAVGSARSPPARTVSWAFANIQPPEQVKPRAVCGAFRCRCGGFSCSWPDPGCLDKHLRR